MLGGIDLVLCFSILWSGKEKGEGVVHAIRNGMTEASSDGV